MSFEIVHPEKPTEQDKIDDNDYMLPHQINGVLPDFSSFPGMKARIPILIEKKTVSPARNSVLFENLNGNNDHEYLIIIDGSCAAPTGGIRFYLYPNSDTGNYYWVGFGANTGASPFRWSGDPLMLGAANTGTPVYIYSVTTFTAKTGARRKFQNSFTTLRSTEVFNIISGGFYTETATNITSLLLKLATATHTFGGTIKLYKIVDINLEDLTPT